MYMLNVKAAICDVDRCAKRFQAALKKQQQRERTARALCGALTNLQKIDTSRAPIKLRDKIWSQLTHIEQESFALGKLHPKIAEEMRELVKKIQCTIDIPRATDLKPSVHVVYAKLLRRTQMLASAKYSVLQRQKKLSLYQQHMNDRILCWETKFKNDASDAFGASVRSIQKRCAKKVLTLEHVHNDTKRLMISTMDQQFQTLTQKYKQMIDGNAWRSPDSF